MSAIFITCAGMFTLFPGLIQFHGHGETSYHDAGKKEEDKAARNPGENVSSLEVGHEATTLKSLSRLQSHNLSALLCRNIVCEVLWLEPDLRAGRRGWHSLA